MIYTIDQQKNPPSWDKKFSEANMNSRKGTRDFCADSYGFPLSIQHCMRGEGVFILIAATGKEIPKNLCVIQILLAGIVAI